MPQSVFISYRNEDKKRVDEIKVFLERASIEVFIDSSSLRGGDDWLEQIRRYIKNCTCFLPCFSIASCTAERSYFSLEIRMALFEAALRNPDYRYIVPIRLDDCEVPEYHLNEAGLRIRDFQWINWFQGGDIPRRELTGIVQGVPESVSRDATVVVQDSTTPQIEGMKNEIWDELEKIARTIAANSGISAMAYYRNALLNSEEITSGANPSTLADEQAMVSAVQSMHTLQQLLSKTGYEHISIFGEELANEKIGKKIKKLFRETTIHGAVKCSADAFRDEWEKSIAVLVDPIDGTVAFDAGVPFFCSSVAIFVGGRLSVSAIYDPFHHEIYLGSLRVLEDGSEKREAKKWTVASGTAVPFESKLKSVTRPLIATHLTRSDDSRRVRMLEFLRQLYEQTRFSEGRGTYMLNSGEMALAYVAQGNIDAFINNTTGIWDVAAGEVLIRAVGGRVTDFFARSINYQLPERISVLAARDPDTHKELKEIIDSHYPFYDERDKSPTPD